MCKHWTVQYVSEVASFPVPTQLSVVGSMLVGRVWGRGYVFYVPTKHPKRSLHELQVAGWLPEMWSGKPNLGSNWNVFLSEFTTSKWCCKLFHVTNKNVAERESLCVLGSSINNYIQDCCKFSPLSGWPSAQNTHASPQVWLEVWRCNHSSRPASLERPIHVFGAWTKRASRLYSLMPRLPVERVFWEQD